MAENGCRNGNWSVIKAVTILQRFRPLVGCRRPSQRPLSRGLARGRRQAQRTPRGRAPLFFGDEAVPGLHAPPESPTVGGSAQPLKIFLGREAKMRGFPVLLSSPHREGARPPRGNPVPRRRKDPPPVSSPGNVLGVARADGRPGTKDRERRRAAGRREASREPPRRRIPARGQDRRPCGSRGQPPRGRHRPAPSREPAGGPAWSLESAPGRRLTPTPAWSACSTVCGGGSLCA